MSPFKNRTQLLIACKIKSCLSAVPSITCPPPSSYYPISFPTKTLMWALCSIRPISTLLHTHHTHYHHFTFAHTALSHPQKHFLPRPLPSQSVFFGDSITSDQEHGLCFSVAMWPWASVNFRSPGLLIHKVVMVKISAPLKVILRTKSKALSTVPSTQYTWANIIFQKSFRCLIFSTRWHFNTPGRKTSKDCGSRDLGEVEGWWKKPSLVKE